MKSVYERIWKAERIPVHTIPGRKLPYILSKEHESRISSWTHYYANNEPIYLIGIEWHLHHILRQRRVRSILKAHSTWNKKKPMSIVTSVVDANCIQDAIERIKGGN